MSEQTAIVTTQSTGLMPILTIQDAIARYNAVVDFTRKVMKSGKDYGVVPGTGNKPTLLKPGAEKLCSLFGMVPDFDLIDCIKDFDGGLFYFQYRCDLYRNGNKVGSGLGSCNSREKKYRYRNVTEKQATEDDKARAIRVEERSGQYGKYRVYVVENLEPFDLVNTVDKMAQKRALIAATLIAANASEFFTQDIEDIDIVDGEYHEQEPAPPPAQPKAQPASAHEPHGNGNSWNPVQLLIENGLAENNYEAAGILNKYAPQNVKTSAEALLGWARLYRAWRDAGSPPEAAAKNATEGVPFEVTT